VNPMNDMKNLGACLLLTILSSFGVAAVQIPCSRYNPACVAPHPGNALKPAAAETDYGKEVDDLRAVFFAKTIDNVLYWSASSTLLLLIGAAFIIFQNGLDNRHQQIIAAGFLASYHNQLVDAHERVGQETEKFERFRTAVEARRILSATASAVPAPQASAPAVTDALTTENNTLRQKISLMEKTEQALRKENSELKRLLRQKNDKKIAAQSGSLVIQMALGQEEENEKR
jgi:hypothetical protein